MPNNDHVTKADLKAGLDDLRNELKADFRAELKAELKASEDRMMEFMRDIETKLLKAFYGFAETTQQRLREHDSYSQRLDIVERRLTDLEKRINFPNAP